MPRSSSSRSPRPAPPPLDAAALDQLALGYVGRFATTRAKLASYLKRKLRERGWDGDDAPPVEVIVERIAGLGYVDDAQFAAMRGASLARRGYGARRVAEDLKAAGVAGDDAAAATAAAHDAAWDSAIACARRRRIGPFAKTFMDPDGRRRALQAMLRAGHGLGISRKLVGSAPGQVPERDG